MFCEENYNNLSDLVYVKMKQLHKDTPVYIIVQDVINTRLLTEVSHGHLIFVQPLKASVS